MENRFGIDPDTWRATVEPFLREHNFTVEEQEGDEPRFVRPGGMSLSIAEVVEAARAGNAWKPSEPEAED
jgi:hypothetical protein